MQNNSYTWEEIARELGISTEELIKVAFEQGLIDQEGNPTQKAINEGLLEIDTGFSKN